MSYEAPGGASVRWKIAVEPFFSLVNFKRSPSGEILNLKDLLMAGVWMFFWETWIVRVSLSVPSMLNRPESLWYVLVPSCEILEYEPSFLKTIVVFTLVMIVTTPLSSSTSRHNENR